MKVSREDLSTKSEKLFYDYLEERNITAEYEVSLGNKNPDFMLNLDPEVICEVKEFIPPKDSPKVGFIDPYAHIRRAIKKKAQQGKGAKGKLPYVLVLGGYRGPAPLSTESVLGAMYGNIQFRIPIDGEPGEATTGFGQDSLLQPQKNTTFSALALISRINPTQKVFEAALDKELEAETAAEAWEQIVAISEGLQRAGTYDPALRVPRIRIYHNVFAAIPLSDQVFTGDYDEQWGLVDGHSIGQISRGEGLP